MCVLGLYPRRDPVYQDYYLRQFILARNRISHFPETNELVENFTGYENLFWKESRNKIFLISTIYPHRPFVPREFLIGSGLGAENIDDALELPLLDLNEDPNYPELLNVLENGLKYLVKDKLNSSLLGELKNRISDYDYFVSDSAFSEIYIASKIGEKLGFENIVLNPSLSTGQTGDIKINLNGLKIYLELTATTHSLAEIKIQRIFNDFAEFLGTLYSDQPNILSVVVNTLSFTLDQDSNIDEESSKSLLQDWAERLSFRNLINCNFSLNLGNEFFSFENEEFLSDIVESQQEIDPSFKNISDNEANRNWAQNVRIQDLNACPFDYLSCNSESSETSIHVEGDNSFPSEIGILEERSFFGKISRSIHTKINENQFESGHPAIILLKTNFWANWFENDDSDFQKIKQVIEDEFETSTWVTGVLIYQNDFRHGKFIPNENCSRSIRLNDEQINLLFSE